jgi:hypothetical protein
MPAWLNPGLVILIGAIVVALGGFWQFSKQSASSERIAALNRELAEKSEQIADMNKRALQWVSGGDSYAYYAPALSSDGSLGFFLQHSGQYPAYDVCLRVQDDETGRLREEPRIVAPMLLAHRGLAWLAPDSLLFPNPPPQNARAHRLTLEVSMRSGTIIIQHLRIWPENGRWHTESKDIRLADGTPPPRPPVDFKEFHER